MFNWERIWSDIKEYFYLVVILSALLGGLIYFIFPHLLQALIAVPIPYFEK